MEKRHIQLYRQLLKDIQFYSSKILGMMSYGAGDLHQWTNDFLSECRVNMSDVQDFLRGQASQGIRYGNHGVAAIARSNLRQIEKDTEQCVNILRKDAGHFPAWVEYKIVVTADKLKRIYHWIMSESEDGRVYGNGMGRGRSAERKQRRNGPNFLRYWSIPVNGKRYGVPGIPFPQPGWAGNAGVAQMPRPGASAAPRAAETYGSLGYASMGDGSMDMAIRGSRRRR